MLMLCSLFIFKIQYCYSFIWFCPLGGVWNYMSNFSFKAVLLSFSLKSCDCSLSWLWHPWSRERGFKVFGSFALHRLVISFLVFKAHLNQTSEKNGRKMFLCLSEESTLNINLNVYLCRQVLWIERRSCLNLKMKKKNQIMDTSTLFPGLVCLNSSIILLDMSKFFKDIGYM